LTFNFVPGLKYPLKGWDKAFMYKRLDSYAAIAKKCGVALWCGEFGVTSRDGPLW